MVARLKVHQIDLPIFDVVKYGAKVDGTTNDTAAWQSAINAAGTAGGGRVISSKPGVSIIAGALQDTSGANAQLLLPSIDAVDSEQITIVIGGLTPPPAVVSVIGTTPVPDNHLVLKSTLTSGSGGALLGGQGPGGTFELFTNLHLRLENVTFRMPSNPTHTALDLSKVTAADLDNVMVDVGSYYVQGLTEPTTTTSFGIRCPKINNGAFTRLGAVNVIGFYKGYEFNEHTVGEQVAAWGCRQAFVFTAANHASKFQRLMAVHCQRGMVFTGTHYVDVDQFNIEHAASGWWVTVYDIDDASNYGHGKVKWHVVLAGVGIDTTWTVNGATGISASRVGTESTGTTVATDTIWNAKGDLAAATGADAAARVAVGSNGQVLTADSGESAGVKWSAPVSGPGELLMQDGVTAPPVPIETEARDDWLYSG